jgi:hypothetical protein
MIIREWRATAAPSKAEAYPKHFHDNVVPELRLLADFHLQVDRGAIEPICSLALIHCLN